MTITGYDQFGKAEVGMDTHSFGAVPAFAKPYEIGCSADIARFVRER